MIDPALKLLPGTPLDPGYLVVDNRIVDGDKTSMELLREIMQSRDTLQENGVGWVLIDWGSVSPRLDMSRAVKALNEGGYQRTLDIENYSLYRIPNPNLDDEHITDVPVRIGIGMYWFAATIGFWLAIWALYAAWSIPELVALEVSLRSHSCAQSRTGQRRPALATKSSKSCAHAAPVASQLNSRHLCFPAQLLAPLRMIQ